MNSRLMTSRRIIQPAVKIRMKYLAWFLLLIIISSQSSRLTSSLASGDNQNSTSWLYLRDGCIPNRQNDLTELLIVGDIMLGRGILHEYQPFRHVTKKLTESKFLFGNLEGAISLNNGSLSSIRRFNEANQFIISLNSEAARSLKSAGFDLISLANNHSLDEGQAGLENTAAILSGTGINVIGSGKNIQEANQAFIKEINGIRVAFLAVNAIRSPQDNQFRTGENKWQIADWDLDRISISIRDAKINSDAVVIMVHWGYENEIHSSLSQNDAAQFLIDQGSDVVIGVHPHVVQETAILERNKDKERVGFVAYSLGNFIFDQYDELNKFGLSLRLLFDKSGLAAVEALPVLSGVEPRWVEGVEAQKLIERIRPAPKIISYRCTIRGLPTH